LICVGVVVQGRDGQRLQFPASALRPFVTETGVHGEFRLRFDKNFQLINIERIP